MLTTFCPTPPDQHLLLTTHRHTMFLPYRCTVPLSNIIWYIVRSARKKHAQFYRIQILSIFQMYFQRWLSCEQLYVEDNWPGSLNFSYTKPWPWVSVWMRKVWQYILNNASDGRRWRTACVQASGPVLCTVLWCNSGVVMGLHLTVFMRRGHERMRDERDNGGEGVRINHTRLSALVCVCLCVCVFVCVCACVCTFMLKGFQGELTHKKQTHPEWESDVPSATSSIIHNSYSKGEREKEGDLI